MPTDSEFHPTIPAVVETRADALELMIEADQDYQIAAALHDHIMADSKRLLQVAREAAVTVNSLVGQIETLAPLSNIEAQLVQATQQMQEMQMSFNLQYLMLQENMQEEERQFTLLSNIMKTKYDTAKNSIANIR
jgi:hypothetical protein